MGRLSSWSVFDSWLLCLTMVLFFNINQVDGEKFAKYLARLKSQSTTCDFQVTCPAEGCGEEVSFVDKMLFFAAMKGMGSEEFRG